MIKRLIFINILLFFILSLRSQIVKPGKPESFSIKTKNATEIPYNILNAIDTSKLIAEDKKTGIPNRYGVVQKTDLDIKVLGLRSEIKGKGFIWQYEIKSLQAYSLGITFGRYRLPDGANVFIYNKTHTQLSGGFTRHNNNSLNQLTITDFKGQNAIIEYFEPYNPIFPGELVIHYISQAYTNPVKASSARIGINCTEGANWQDAKHAVCRMSFHDAFYSYICTGFLINNVRQDGTPYFQTANHCINSSNEAATLVTYFNYEDSICNSSDASTIQTLSGATLMATSSYTDFTLLLLNESPPNAYKPYYAGWDASTRNPLNGTGIHHPEGTPKCISIDNNAPVTFSRALEWTDENDEVVSTSSPYTHWEVKFDAGSTEGGSSGSPLFDDNQRVIGQLHGGSDIENYYGKFSQSWSHGSSNSTKLKYWLDPDNTGTLSLDGYYDLNKPKASFATILTNICPGTKIILTDESQYNPTSWYWDIKPATYKFTDNTTRYSQNPKVIFDSAGNYTVSLVVVNVNGSDSITKTDYILAGDINVNLYGISADSVVCGCDLNNFPIYASGATNYNFHIEKPEKFNYSVSSNTIYLSILADEKKNGSFNNWIKVIGTQGACISSDSIEMKVSMPVNDNIENAIKLRPGRNGPYTNFCASVEENEATPTSTDIKNTIWFKFNGPSSGILNIDTRGFNDRIAIYDAGSYSDLLSDFKSSYTLKAFNDDRSESDNTALIENLSVDPFKTYWLQVDGINGSTGDLVIDFLSNSLLVFPNPSTGVFNLIISDYEDGTAEIQIISMLGQVLYINDMAVSKESNHFTFNLDNYPSGIYFLIVNINGSSMKTKFLISN